MADFNEEKEQDDCFGGNRRFFSWRRWRRVKAAPTRKGRWRRECETERFRRKGDSVQQERTRGNSQDLGKRSSLRCCVFLTFVGANQAGRQERASQRCAIPLGGVEFCFWRLVATGRADNANE